MHAIVANDDATGGDVADQAADQDENIDRAHADDETDGLLLRSEMLFQDLHASLVAMVTTHIDRRHVLPLVSIGNGRRGGRGQLGARRREAGAPDFSGSGNIFL